MRLSLRRADNISHEIERLVASHIRCRLQLWIVQAFLFSKTSSCMYYEARNEKALGCAFTHFPEFVN